MTPAQEFLSRVVPWPGDDTPGYVNLHWRAVNTKEPDKKYWGGKPTRTVNEFLGAAAWASARDFIEDLYFCTSLQSQAGKNSKGNPTVLRSKDLAVSLRAIWLDVDVKEPPKGYATLKDALAGVAKFVKDAELPPPSALVATGGGLHVYWISDRDLPVAVWQPYADGLKFLAIKHGLLCDAGVTTDAARILRVPGTYNYKQVPPRPVLVLGIKPKELDYDFSHQLQLLPTLVPVHAPARGTTTLLQGKPSSLFADLQTDTLSAGIEREEVPLDWRPIATQCGFIGEALKTGGKDYSQPMWNLSTLAATFMENGNALAHRMGRDHAGYTPESTEALWDRKIRERKNRGLGWPSCSAIQAAGCKSCATCQHFSKGKSPLNLGAPVQKIEAETGEVSLVPDGEGLLHLPFGYKLKAGYICKIEAVKGKAGEAGETIETQLFHNIITNPRVEGNPKALSFTVSTDKGHTERVTILAQNIVNGAEMWKMLQGQGLLPIPRQRANCEEFLMAWLSKLQEAKEALSSTPFGWWRDASGARKGFAFGGVIMKDDGTEVPNGQGDRSLRALYAPVGTIQPWLTALKVITDQKRPDLEAIVASSFAAPLIVTPAEYSCMLAVWGPSAAFKSTAMKVGLAVWGHPKLTKEVTKSTSRSVLQKMGETKNLPLYWDEIREDTLQNLYEVFFDATLGVGPGRLKSDATQRDKVDWQTMLVTGSNYNFVDFLINMQKSTDAGIHRVFEYEMSVPGENAPGILTTMDASRIMQELEANYGVMGMKYAKLLSGAPEAIDSMTKEICENFATEVKQTQKERFWTATCGTILAGAKLANALGATFDEAALHDFLVKTYYANRIRRQDEATEGGTEIHAEEILTNFLRDKLDRTLYTDTFPQGRGKPPAISVIHGPRVDGGKGIEVHWAIKDHLLRFSRTEFRKYLHHQKIPASSILRGLKDHFGMDQTYAMLGAGTPWNVGQAHLICIPVKEGTALHGLMMAHRPALGASEPQPQFQQRPPAPLEVSSNSLSLPQSP
jgi:hypothetical protein